MKQRMVWRYTCEFCKKSNCSKYHMNRHEQACTANPNRICRMCNMPVFMNEILAATKQCTEEDITALREVTEGCPACMLAGIRQSKRQCPPTSFEDQGFFFTSFDFKKEKESFWKGRTYDESAYDY